MLRDDLIPNLAAAKAEEKAARVDKSANVDFLLEKTAEAAGLDAKKRACEKQIRNARREVEALRRAGPPGSPHWHAASAERLARESASEQVEGRQVARVEVDHVTVEVAVAEVEGVRLSSRGVDL